MKLFFAGIALFALLFCTGTSIGGAIISEFRAEPGMNRVELKWVVTHESQIRGYRIYRSLDSGAFTVLDFVPCREGESGEKTYTFVDETVFKSNGNTFRYKLAIVDAGDDERFYDRVLSVNPQISSARHTWGSIKAMFR